MSIRSQNQGNAKGEGAANTETPTMSPDQEPERFPADKKNPRRLARFIGPLFRTATLIATLVLAVATFYQAKATAYQAKATADQAKITAAEVEASHESIELQHQVLTKFKLALDQFSEELEIAKDNRKSLKGISDAAHQTVSTSKQALGGAPEILEVDGTCRLERTEDKQMYVLVDLTDCDYVKVVIRNPGKVAIKAHAVLTFNALNIPCTSNTLEIAPLETKNFAVRVDTCLARRPPGSPNKVNFLVTADIEGDKP
jgi:hypothetical protein